MNYPPKSSHSGLIRTCAITLFCITLVGGGIFGFSALIDENWIGVGAAIGLVLISGTGMFMALGFADLCDEVVRIRTDLENIHPMPYTARPQQPQAPGTPYSYGNGQQAPTPPTNQ